MAGIMELLGDGAAAAEEPPRRSEIARIRLRFEGSDILSPQQRHDGLSNSWFLLQPRLRCIADLAADIVSAFRLLKSCPHGISLKMDNFTLPPSQPIHLLKDKDIVSIIKKVVASNLVDEGFLLRDSSSLDGFNANGHLGIKCSALDEFERESGGYESEKEEDAPEIRHDVVTEDLSTSPLKPKHRKRKHVESERDLGTSMKKSKQKRQKHSRDQRDDDLEATEENTVVDDGKLKRKKPTTRHKEKNEVLNSSMEKSFYKIESPKVQTKKGKKSSSEVKKNMKKDATVCGRKEHTEKVKDDKDDASSTSSSSETLEDEENMSNVPLETESAKRPSRSSRRKKAKRFWKRTNKDMLERNKTPDAGNNTSNRSNQVLPVLESRIEDDGEAEEEKLPIVVRPGHIRFEPIDEDDDGIVEARPTMPAFNWNDGISKKKGQSWGQEKTRRGNRNQKEGIGMECLGSQAVEPFQEPFEAQEIQYETFPSLERTPQIGDIIAYRMLELTSSFTPEVSDYRVGEVVEFEAVSGMLKVSNVPKYSSRQNDDQQDQTECNEDLQVLLTDLIEVRLVEGASCTGQNNSADVEPPSSKLSNPVTLIQDSIVHDHVEIEQYSNLQTCLPQTNPLEEKQSFTTPILRTRTQPEELTPVCDEISEALRKRKEELVMVQTDQSRDGGDMGKLKSVESGKRSRAWVRRAGGLGATIALLRSQMSSEA